MTRRYWPLILTLASLWGASYFLIKVGVDGGFSPSALMASRALLAALVLIGYLSTTIGLAAATREIRAAWRACVVLGTINAAVPFWLVAWGETRIDSGIAAIAQATVPLFSLLIGLQFLPQEHIGRLRVAGVGLGIVGVALIAGVAPAGNVGEVIGTFAVILASLFYASAGIYGQLRLSGTTSGPVLATGNMLAAGLILLPFAILQHPTSMPTTGALGSLVLLAVLPTALAQLILFRTIALFGARRLSLVTYLMPGIALFYGAVLLGEQVTVAAVAGLVLILLGVALGSGTLRPGRRSAEPPAAGPQDER
ncbi:DMT family transporter [Gaiella sp.]|uniref:DMT family transporter n=1 Tax=Gaiella sp. TaxID=2663207 RepID=UPI0032648A1C